MRYAIPAFILGLLLGGGALWLALRDHHDHEHDAPEEEPRLQRTIWSGRTEVFLEHAPLVAGQGSDFVTHVTELASAEPRRRGAIAYEFRRAGGGTSEHTADEPARAGIYLQDIALPQAGEWTATLRVDDERIDLGTFEVRATGDKDQEHPDPKLGEVTFLKEQQWKLSTKAEPVGKRRLVQRLRVPGMVEAPPGRRVALTPPVDGRLIAPPGGALPSLGRRVEAGEVLALVQPPLSDFTSRLIEAEADVQRTKVALEQAEAAAVRLRRLVAEKARTERELQDAEFALRSARASHEAAVASRTAYGKSGAVLLDGSLPAFELRSPVGGVVMRIDGVPGENVHAERPVFTILDASRVHLVARVPEASVPKLGASRGALYSTPDAPGRLVPAGDAPIFTGAEVDPATHTVPLVYETSNADGTLRVGMALTLHVETARAEDAVAVPESAVIDEEGRFVAFVQVTGETFEKRDVAIGLRDAGRAQVLSGLREGERVVTRGAYAVRLASVAPSIPSHGHAH